LKKMLILILTAVLLDIVVFCGSSFTQNDECFWF